MEDEADDGLAPELENDEADHEDADDALDGDEGGHEEGGDEGEEDEGDGLEDVEWGGAKHRLPPAIKEALARHDALTQDAEGFNAQRQAFERQRTAAIEADNALRSDYGKVAALAQQVEEFEGLDWAELNRADPATAQSLFFDYQKAQRALTAAETEFKGKVAAHNASRSEALSSAMKDCGNVLKREIPGFDGKLANQLAEFGVREFGITPAEVKEMADPRIWKLLHRAMSAAKGDRKAIIKAKVSKQQAVQPAAKAGGGGKGAPVSGLSDRASAADWIKARNKQLAKKK